MFRCQLSELLHGLWFSSVHIGFKYALVESITLEETLVADLLMPSGLFVLLLFLLGCHR
uniref:Uncharacterized protein n=1 Tax=Nelumbo nucifera TaxID=4432 RepID=A0A822XPF6_NELNU|nr:TPA_asm: hypothetical protein HUJ06_023650 [Nelumbo nucifera]